MNTPEKTTANSEKSHKAIDLGLPSGTKGASCNIGASKPEDYGGFYAWGETKKMNTYDWSTYLYYDSTSGDCLNLGSDIAGTQHNVAHILLWVRLLANAELRTNNGVA